MYDVPVVVKDALRSGAYRKNYRFLVLNDDGTTDFTIDNDNLVSESVNIDERMCSGDTLKFGLCEGSSLEFQYFGKPNITGRRVQSFIDVEYGEALPCSIPMGFFDVKNCSRQASTGIIKASCYNKLMSEYLDADATEVINSEDYDEDESGSISLYSLLNNALAGYSIDYRPPIVGEPYVFDTPFTQPAKYIVRLYDSAGQATYYLHLCSTNSKGYTDTVLDKYTAAQIGESLFVTTEKYIGDVLADTRAESAYVMASPTANGTYSLVSLTDLLSTSQYDSYFVITYDTPTPSRIRVGFIKGMCYWRTRATPAPTNYLYPFIGFVSYNEGNPITSYHWPEDIAMEVQFPMAMYIANNTTGDSHKETSGITYWNDTVITEYGGNVGNSLYKQLSPMEDMRFSSPIADSKVTLRELQTAVFESQCQFGQLSRITDLFSGVELNHSRLYPADTLYPSDSLYPDGAAESAFRSQYSKLWADEGNVHKWRYLIITYKGLDENNQEQEFTLQRTVNADGTDDYNMSDNWLFKNLVWTASDVGDYADAMVAKMQDITWFPFELWGAGLPYLETGDEIEIPLGEETYTSYILERQLKGIQNLQDTYINGTLDIF